MTEMATTDPAGRVGLLARGDRQAIDGVSARAQAMLGPLIIALGELGVAAEAVTYFDDAIEEVRDQLLGLDGVLVWVNPIQEGANRSDLDALLREVSTGGVWVSAHPDVIARMGTKEVLFATRTLGWGTDTQLYRSPAEFAQQFPARLGRHGVLVVKQARGNGGNGVWQVDLIGHAPGSKGTPGTDAPVRVRHAQPPEALAEETTLGVFLDRCRGYFSWSGYLIDQPYQARLGEGMIRCYFCHEEIVGFCHQWPKALLETSESEGQTPLVPAAHHSIEMHRLQARMFEDPETSAYQALKMTVTSDWVPKMKALLGLDTHSLPVIWDADFLYGPKTAFGEDSYVLCEINVSAVWPYPPHATKRVAEATRARIFASKKVQA